MAEKVQLKYVNTTQDNVNSGVTTSNTLPKTNKIKINKEFENELKTVDPPEVNNAIGYAFKLGALDTVRGVTQLTGFRKEELEAEQEKLKELMQGKNGSAVTAAYFAGLLLDPASWLIPFGKAKSLAQMGKYGMVSGAIAGATGYVDKNSVIDDRGTQAALGALGGGIVAPGFGILKNLGVTVTKKGTKIPLRLKRDNISPEEAVKRGATKIQLQGTADEIDVDVGGTGQITTVGERTVIKGSEKDLTEKPKSFFDTLIETFRTTPLKKQPKESDIPIRGSLLNKQSGFINRTLKGYENTVGQRALKAIKTGEGGTALAGTVLGFNTDPTAPIFDFQDPLSSRLGRAFVVGGLGYLGIKTAKGVKIRKRIGEEEFVEGLGEILGRSFIDKYGLPKSYKESLYQTYEGQKNHIASQFVRIAKQLREDLTEDELKILYNMLEGDTLYDIPSATLSKFNERSRKLITEIGQKYVDLGLITKKTFDQNKDKYLGRLYLKDELSPQLRRVGDDLKPRGSMAEVSVEDWFTELSKMKITVDGRPAGEWQIFDETIAVGRFVKRTIPGKKAGTSRKVREFVEDENGGTIVKVLSRDKPTQTEQLAGQLGQVRKVKQLKPSDLITVRRQYTKAERLQMGEIEDAAIALEYTGALMSNTVAKYSFFAEIADKFALTEAQIAGKTAQKLATEGYRKIPSQIIEGTKASKYGKLSGKYVPEAVFKDIVGFQRYQNQSSNAFYRTYRRMNSLWKSSKTAWNPTVHVNNMFGNVILSDLADVPIIRGVDGEKFPLLKAFKMLTEHNKVGGEESDLVQRAIQFGVMDADFVNKELKNFKLEQLADIYKARTDKGEWGNTVDMVSKIYKKVRNNEITSTLEDWYRIEDHVFRLNAFRHRIKMGDSDIDAAMFARKQFIDYDINAPVINALRHSVVPFLSFTYRVVPILAETAALRPHKYVKYAALGYGLNKMSELYGGEEEKEEAKFIRANLPEYEAGRILDMPFMPHKVVRLPVKDRNGNNKYLNISRLFPGGDALSFRATGLLPFFPEPLQPTAGIGGDLITSFIGYDILRKRAEPGRGLSDNIFEESGLALKSFGKKLIPNFPFIPGAYATQRLDRARRGDVSEFREPETELQALVNAFGIKLSNKSVRTLANKQKLDYQRVMRVKKSQVSSLKRQYKSGAIDEQEFYKRLGKLQEEARDIQIKFLKKFEGYDPYAFRLLDDIFNPNDIDIDKQEETQDTGVKLKYIR